MKYECVMLTNSRTEESNVTWTLLLKCDLFITKCLLECVIGVNVCKIERHTWRWIPLEILQEICQNVFISSFCRELSGAWSVTCCWQPHFTFQQILPISVLAENKCQNDWFSPVTPRAQHLPINLSARKCKKNEKLVSIWNTISTWV